MLDTLFKIREKRVENCEIPISIDKLWWTMEINPANILVTPGQDDKSDFDNVMEIIELIRKIYLTNN